MSIILPIARVEQELSRSGRGMCPERVERDESADQGGRRSQPLDSATPRWSMKGGMRRTAKDVSFMTTSGSRKV